LARRSISASDCRRLALTLPETTEGVHSGLATFHVAGKRFATLGWPDGTSVSLMLDRAEQEVLVAAASQAFSRFPAAGVHAATLVCVSKPPTRRRS
jgi:YjbR